MLVEINVQFLLAFGVLSLVSEECPDGSSAPVGRQGTPDGWRRLVADASNGDTARKAAADGARRMGGIYRCALVICPSVILLARRQ